MGASSKSCSRVDGPRMKAKFTPNLRREQENEIKIKEVASTISSSNEDKSSSIENAAQVNTTDVNDFEVGPKKTEVKQKKVLATRSAGLLKENNFNAIERVSKPRTSLDLTPKTSLFSNEKRVNYRKETVRYKKGVSGARSDDFYEDNRTISSETVSKPVSSLDLTPKTCPFTEKKVENTPICVPEQKNVGKLTTSHNLSRKIPSSLQFAAASSGWQKSKIAKTDSVSKRASLGKIKQIENIAGTVLEKKSTAAGTSNEAKDSENNSHTKHVEYKRLDSGPKRSEANTKVQSGEQELSKLDSKPFDDGKEKIVSGQSSVSTHNQQLDDFSQSIFSQSLFDDVLEDQSANDDLSDICEPSTAKRANNETNTCKTGMETATVNKKFGQIYYGDVEKQKSGVKNSDADLILSSKLKRSAADSTTSRRSTDILPSNIMQLEEYKATEEAAVHNLGWKPDASSDMLPNNSLQENDLISLKENDAKGSTNLNIPKEDAAITELSSNLPQVHNTGGEAEKGELSTNVMKDASYQQDGTDIASTSSRKTASAKGAQAEIGSNQSSDLEDCKSRFLLEETDRQLETKETTYSQSIIAEYNPVSENEEVLLKQQAEGLQPELIEDTLTDLHQTGDIFDSELSAFDTRSKTESMESEARKQTNTASQEFKNLQFHKCENSSNFEELLLSQPSSILSQNARCEGHSSQGVTPILREICLQVL